MRYWTSTTLPDKVKRLLFAEDRKALGEAGRTTAEAMEAALLRAEVKSEKDLQNVVVALLRLKEIKAIRARMDKKTTTEVGTMDLFFAVWIVDNRGNYAAVPCAWEVKLPGKKMSEDQVKMAGYLTTPPNAWRWSIITSAEEARDELRALGL